MDNEEDGVAYLYKDSVNKLPHLSVRDENGSNNQNGNESLVTTPQIESVGEVNILSNGKAVETADDVCTDGYNNIDELLQDIGASGLFQWLLLTTLLLTHIPGGIAVWITYFIATDMHWRCESNSSSCTLNQTFPVSNNRICELNDTSWHFVEEKETSIKSHFHLYCGREWLVHVATSAFFVGWALSSLFSTYLVDKFGRKKILFTFFAVFPLVSLISVFSPVIEMLIICRIIAGVSIISAFQVAFIMLGEFTNNKNRALFINTIQIGLAIALILVSGLAFYVRDWRSLVLITTLPFILVLLAYRFVPESMHWLTFKGKKEKLIIVIKKVCYWNKTTISKAPQLSTLSKNVTTTKSRIADLFGDPELRIQSCTVSFGWIVIGTMYYGIGMATDDLTGALYRDFAIMRGIEVPSMFMGVCLANRCGRKKTVCVNLLLASIACILIASVPSDGDIVILRLLLGVTGNFCISISFSICMTWTLELYGTDLRANAMGVSNFMLRIGGGAAPWVFKGLKIIDPNAPFFLTGGLGIVCALFMLLLLPETKDTPMRGISKKDDTVISARRLSNTLQKQQSVSQLRALGKDMPFRAGESTQESSFSE